VPLAKQIILNARLKEQQRQKVLLDHAKKASGVTDDAAGVGTPPQQRGPSPLIRLAPNNLIDLPGFGDAEPAAVQNSKAAELTVEDDEDEDDEVQRWLGPPTPNPPALKLAHLPWLSSCAVSLSCSHACTDLLRCRQRQGVCKTSGDDQGAEGHKDVGQRVAAKAPRERQAVRATPTLSTPTHPSQPRRASFLPCTPVLAQH